MKKENAPNSYTVIVAGKEQVSEAHQSPEEEGQLPEDGEIIEIL